jgi:sialic acid synthase SpsE/mannose-6-phosphate isomerase-like protein (cupin superfamily)
MQKKPFDFSNLFIYDLANNHQGDVEHAANVIRGIGRVNATAGVRGALKFQFRQLETFIHPDFRTRTDLKYIKRFMDTRLPQKAFADMAGLIRESGMLTMCTPFDEESVDVICQMDLDIIKVASASADDRPLLEKIARVNKPIVVSTAGLRTEEIDWLVNFLESSRAEFAVMHCVAEYPTPDNKLQLNQIQFLSERYRGVPIGWSTHENPDNLDPIKIAYAAGARLFERHVGLQTPQYKLNDYSSTPEQIERWLAAHQQVKVMMGASERVPSSVGERQTLRDLKRGIFAKRDVAKGEEISREDVFFAMPVQGEQLLSSQWRPGMIANADYPAKAALPKTLGFQEVSDEQLIYQIMLQVRGMLNKANIHINEDASIEISHHYGLRRFREYGAVIITCVNRSYAKKLVIQLPRQKHPYHYHETKEETFQLLDGDLEIVKEGERTSLREGDTFLVEPRAWHKFHTLAGAIVEEVSTTHTNNDSFYEDPEIVKLSREERKTKADRWLAYFRSSHAL